MVDRERERETYINIDTYIKRDMHRDILREAEGRCTKKEKERERERERPNEEYLEPEMALVMPTVGSDVMLLNDTFLSATVFANQLLLV
jgi:hypothetical protein